MEILKINEIFYSIQGESSLVGQPTLFVRTTGCNLRCTYCDTTYSYYEGSEWTLEALIEKVQGFPTKYICITGGEPLLQTAVLTLMSRLCDQGYKVSLETSGSRSCHPVDPRVKIILDIKTPDSGAQNSFHWSNLDLVRTSRDENSFSQIEVKFVITSENDFLWAEDFCRTHHLFDHALVLYSPSHKKIEPRWLAEKMLHSGSMARLQVQLHKYIWPSESRGV